MQCDTIESGLGRIRQVYSGLVARGLHDHALKVEPVMQECGRLADSHGRALKRLKGMAETADAMQARFLLTEYLAERALIREAALVQPPLSERLDELAALMRAKP